VSTFAFLNDFIGQRLKARPAAEAAPHVAETQQRERDRWMQDFVQGEISW
jgi:hypothetical protein